MDGKLAEGSFSAPRSGGVLGFVAPRRSFEGKMKRSGKTKGAKAVLPAAHINADIDIC